MSTPRISVVVPNYNHALHLPQCLDALLLDQTLPPHEIIVIDDGSTDDSRAVIEAYVARSPLVRHCPNPHNLGVIPTVNRGLELATGDYVCFPGADDQVLPELFASATPLLVQHPAAGAVCGLTEWRCHATGLAWIHGTSMPQDLPFIPPDALVTLAREGRLALSGQHAIYRKDALVQAGRWRPELRWFADAFGNWVVTFRHGVCFVPKVLSIYNLFPTSYYNAAQRSARLEVMKLFLDRLSEPQYADVAPLLASSGMLGGFGPTMLRALLSHPRRADYLTRSFARQVLKRSLEIAARRILPSGLAAIALRLTRRTPKPPPSPNH